MSIKKSKTRFRQEENAPEQKSKEGKKNPRKKCGSSVIAKGGGESTLRKKPNQLVGMQGRSLRRKETNFGPKRTNRSKPRRKTCGN